MLSLPVGKLRAEMLQAFFDKLALRDERARVGPRIGEDAAVIEMGDRYLVATTDPITFGRPRTSTRVPTVALSA